MSSAISAKKRKGSSTPTHSRIRPMSSNTKIINPNRELSKTKAGPTQHMRSKATINRLAMYKQRAVHDKNGHFVSGAYMSRTTDEPVKRIAPNRKWFGNTRVIGQEQLTKFRSEMQNVEKDAYQVVMKPGKLPMSLLSNPFQRSKMNLLTTESFHQTFSNKFRRKHPRLGNNTGDVESLLQHVESTNSQYDTSKDDQTRGDSNTPAERGAKFIAQGHEMFAKGQSKRIWSELYKVIDSSDVVIHVLDARDPLGTRCYRIEDELRKPDRKHKQMIYLLNKCDLIPTWCTRKWVKYLTQFAPTLAFHASITNSFGKGSLIALLRQFANLHSDKKQISVGFVGYPNVGKSSIINTLRAKQVCKAAPVPGQTRVWQYITLFKRIFLIDSPGVVYSQTITETECVMRGVVRVENLTTPEDYIQPILDAVKPKYITQAYGITKWTDGEDFCEQYARYTGKLLKGNEADIVKAAKMILNDFQRGKLPYYNPPPLSTAADDASGKAALANDERLKVDQLYGKIHVKHDFTDKHHVADAEVATAEQMEDIQEEQLKAAIRHNDASATDYDELYAKTEGTEIDADEAEKLLHIEHEDDEEAEEADEEAEEEQLAEDDDEIEADDAQDSIAADTDVEDDADSDDVANAAASSDEAAEPAATAASKKRKRHRKSRTATVDEDAEADAAIAELVSEKPVKREGTDKPSAQSRNKAKKKKRMLAKKKRMRLCR